MTWTHLFCSLALAALTALAPAASAQTLALSFDDGPQLAPTPQLSPAQRNQAMLDALARARVPAALFVTGHHGADRPEGLALARAWGEAGHAIGNHTMSHPDLHKADLSLAQYQAEILACEQLIRPLPGYQPWFRFTYLREGNTPEKREGMREFLRERGLRNAYVSLDTSDWRLDAYLVETLARDPQAELGPIKQAYLDHIWQRAQAYRALSQRLQGRDIAQVMLLHHNLINALWLSDVIAMFKAKGWRFVAPAQAFADPVYALEPARPAPGQSLLLSLARTLGPAKFEGWERLVDDGDFEIERLKAAAQH